MIFYFSIYLSPIYLTKLSHLYLFYIFFFYTAPIYGQVVLDIYCVRYTIYIRNATIQIFVLFMFYIHWTRILNGSSIMQGGSRWRSLIVYVFNSNFILPLSYFRIKLFGQAGSVLFCVFFNIYLYSQEQL